MHPSQAGRCLGGSEGWGQVTFGCPGVENFTKANCNFSALGYWFLNGISSVFAFSD